MEERTALYKAERDRAEHLNFMLLPGSESLSHTLSRTPTPKPKGDCFSTFPQKMLCMIYKRLNYGDTENVPINHLLLVIPVVPMSLYTFVSS